VSNNCLTVGAAAHADEAGGYRFGVACLFSASLFTSLGGVLVRLVEEAGGWQVLFYRSLALVAAMGLFVAVRHRGRVARAYRDVGRPGLAVTLFLGSAFMLFIFALMQTTVANVVFTVSLSPFVAALFAWLALREPVSRATLAVMAVCLGGIGFMFGDGLVAGTLGGNLLALACCLCYSAALVAMRKGRAVDMMPAVVLAGLFAAGVSAVMTPTFAIGAHDLAVALTLGVVQLGFQYMLLTTGTRYVRAAEVALIGRTALVMAPLWVWIAVDEVPSSLTLIGGAVVLIAVSGHGALAFARAPTRAA
jgi:drug/metabolite transporter (DMT)-like permease